MDFRLPEGRSLRENRTIALMSRVLVLAENSPNLNKQDFETELKNMNLLRKEEQDLMPDYLDRAYNYYVQLTTPKPESEKVAGEKQAKTEPELVTT